MNQRALGDNAHMESFFHSLEADIVHGVCFDYDAQILTELRSYMWYYNHRRLHSGLGYRSPVDFEQRAAVFHRLLEQLQGIVAGLLT